MNAPSISVVITTYNRPEKCICAIESVLNQTSPAHEVIVVNDGSTVSYRVVEAFVNRFDKVRYFRKENEDRSAARNFGISRVTGDYVCFLDDDDLYFPDHIETFENFVSASKEVLRTCSHDYAPGNDPFIRRPTSAKEPSRYRHVDELFVNRFAANVVCIPISVAVKFHFHPQLSYFEDLELWLRILKAGYSIQRIDHVTHAYLKHAGSTVASNIPNLKRRIRNLISLRKLHPLCKSTQRFVAKEQYKSRLSLACLLIEQQQRAEAFKLLCLAVFQYPRKFSDKKLYGSFARAIGLRN